MVKIAVDVSTTLSRRELTELCDATTEAIHDGIGFGWVRAPERQRMEAYWKGVLVVPERVLFLGRCDDVVAGSVQLIKPPPSFEAGNFAASIDTHFVVPWGRGHGLAKALLEAAETEARRQGFSVMRLDVRATQERAIAVYESSGYRRWGTLDKYHLVAGDMIAGYFYMKDLD